MVLIKRYSNRKMYNTQTRRYVTLDEIAEMVQLGEEIRVVDHQTGSEMTASVMTQVLARQEKQVGNMVPKALLERMVQLSGQTLFSMRESMKAFLNPAEYMASDIHRRLDQLVESGQITTSEGNRLSGLLLSPELDPVFIQTEDAEPAVTLDELQRLLDQIESLEAEIQQVEAQKKRL
ncbi:MAG: hypothetical protein HPY85_08255 [Anaerolineae bacterium]|nr:hypothetical protein [Anaerolineae bacterium]